ncbi:MAG: competence/damage-inducible protein A [Candidatus Marinimicrobia bacterium]|nr:competence/damage-inducible protein A [Candidatus Neomarinimicrobiota bacterium]
MNAALIIIGNELLSGFTLDSNSTWMGRKLLDIGIKTMIKLTVGDSGNAIIDSLRSVDEKYDIVILSGGLGPTHDDVTKKAFCEFIGAELVFDESYFLKLSESFKRRGIDIPESNRDQAYIPTKGEIIPNSRGSALGLKFVKDKTRFYVVPGVPSEMMTMMDEYILPELSEIAPHDLIITTIRTTGLMESALFDTLKDIMKSTEVDVSFLPGFMGVDIRLSSRNEKVVMELSSNIYDLIGNFIYSEDWETLEETVGRLLREQGLTIAVAESCTGGLLSDRITNIPGSSDYFLGGMVTYDNQAKQDLLGVQTYTLEEFGAVSEQTAKEMAQGVRRVFQGNIGVSITGIAGPDGGTDEKPVGLVFIGLDFEGDTEVRSFTFTKERRFNKELSAQAALNMLRLSIGG